MSSARYARDTCRQNCFSKHWKKHGEPPKVCAFFKNMIGNGFDISMVMPPTFSKKLKSLVGEKFTLEDSSSRKWDVLLTRTEGSLAFVKGWFNFVLDHGIQYDDSLVFYYLNDRRFLVEIYGKSACTKIFSSERIDTNRTTKTTRNSIPRKRSNDSLCEESASKRHFHSSFSGPNIDVTPSPKNAHIEKEPVLENLDELFFMTRRDINFVGEDDRDHLFDLSEFETPVKKPAIKEEEERDYLQGPVFCLPESDKFQNTGTEVGHVDLHKCVVPERRTEVLSEYTEADFLVHECTPHPSNSPNDSVPLDSIKRQQTIHKSENLDLSAPPGLKMRPIHQEARVFKQEVFGNVMAGNSVGAIDYPSEQSYRNPGETLIQTMEVEGGTSKPIKQEAREFKPDINGGPTSGCLDANFFVRELTMINYVGEFVKAEPLDRVYPSEIGVEIACPIPLPLPLPPCSEDFPFEIFLFKRDLLTGTRSMYSIPTTKIEAYANTIGVIAALLATITFTAAFTVPGGLDSSKGTPLLLKKAAFQLFLVADVVAMCSSMMVLFCLLWIMTTCHKAESIFLLDVSLLLLQTSFYATLVTFMTGLYVTTISMVPAIAISTCVACTMLIILMHRRLVFLTFVPFFVTLIILGRSLRHKPGWWSSP